MFIELSTGVVVNLEYMESLEAQYLGHPFQKIMDGRNNAFELQNDASGPFYRDDDDKFYIDSWLLTTHSGCKYTIGHKDRELILKQIRTVALKDLSTAHMEQLLALAGAAHGTLSDTKK